MLKNSELLEKLTIKQKIALLTDQRDVIEGDEELKSIPTLSTTDLWSHNLSADNEKIFPSIASLANSWEREVIETVSTNLAQKGAENGHNLFVLPKTNSASSVYGEEITEDPYLAGMLHSSAVNALSYENFSVCLRAPTVTKEDSEVMDNEADECVLFERVYKPFELAKNCGLCKAVLLENSDIEKSYSLINEKMIKRAVSNGEVVISKIEERDNPIAELNSGKQVLNCSSVTVEAAYENYKKIYHSMEEGGATAHELEMALLDGSAISEKIIDEALDEKISLASACAVNKEKGVSSALEANAVDCAKKSIVLVKNNNSFLPIGRRMNVAVIGDIINSSSSGCCSGYYDALAQSLSDNNVISIGYEPGYYIDEEKSESLIYPAVDLASRADIALVFVGLGAERERNLKDSHKLQLPANQKALICELGKRGKPVVAIVCGTRLPEMSFDKYVSSVLLVPLEGIGVPKAISEVLTANYNPSGKLAYAGYDDIDSMFRNIQTRKRLNKQKIGTFVGYRYTEKCGIDVKYPFGHGLSYTKFNYSSLSIRDNTINFVVQNIGPVAGTETVQVYVGCDDSGVIRPTKELKATCKVYLKPNEKKLISLSFSELKIYDLKYEEFVTESGNYTIYVGSSVSDIRLVGKMHLYGARLTRAADDNQRISDYIYEVSNIRTEGYTMEAYCKPMSKTSKLKSISCWLLALTIFLDIICALCGMFLVEFTYERIITVVIINVVGLLSSLVLYLLYNSKQKELDRQQKAKEQEATDELFQNAVKVDVTSVEKLFIEEFDILESKQTEKKPSSSYMGKDEALYVYMSVDTDFAELCKKMEQYFEDSGLAVSSATVRAVISAITSSRLLVVRNKETRVALKFMEILTKFFGTEYDTYSLSNIVWEKSSLLYATTNELTVSSPTKLHQTFNSAATNKTKVHFYTMTDVTLADTATFMMPYVQFIGNPNGGQSVIESGYRFVIPSNVWFTIIPKAGESIDTLPAFVANIASVIDVDVKEIEPTSSQTIVKPINTQQLEALVYRSKKAVNVDETVWKSVDSLESFVNEHTSYHIGNKIFLQLESYLSVYLSCGGEIEEALDGVVSSRLLPAILSMLTANVKLSDLDLPHTLESIFGEDNVSRCCGLIKNMTINKAETEESDSFFSSGSSSYFGADTDIDVDAETFIEDDSDNDTEVYVEETFDESSSDEEQ